MTRETPLESIATYSFTPHRTKIFFFYNYHTHSLLICNTKYVYKHSIVLSVLCAQWCVAHQCTGAPPQNEVADTMSATVIAVSWDAPDPELAGKLTSFLVTYGISDLTDRQTVEVSTEFFGAVSLEEYTEYVFMIQGMYGGVEGISVTVVGTTYESGKSKLLHVCLYAMNKVKWKSDFGWRVAVDFCFQFLLMIAFSVPALYTSSFSSSNQHLPCSNC